MNVSVIIPTLNEAKALPETLTRLRECGPDEVIIGDGGSEDGTREIAEKFGARWVTSERGRGRQMNAAAREAAGDLLWFLHADSRVRPEDFQAMRNAMDSGRYLGGAFSLQIDSPASSLQVISRLATWRSRYFKMVYGDQGIFVRREVFHQLDGFAPLPICEDMDFFRRLGKQGRTVVLKEKMVTSARRWESDGVLFTTLRNIVIASLFLAGYSPARLSRWYPPRR